MENEAKIIDLNQRKKYKKYKRWFEIYDKFLSIFRFDKKKEKRQRKAKATK